MFLHESRNAILKAANDAAKKEGGEKSTGRSSEGRTAGRTARNGNRDRAGIAGCARSGNHQRENRVVSGRTADVAGASVSPTGLALEPGGEGNSQGVGSVIGARRLVEVEFAGHGVLHGIFVRIAVTCQGLLDLGGGELDPVHLMLGEGQQEHPSGLGNSDGISHAVEEEFFDSNQVGLHLL